MSLPQEMIEIPDEADDKERVLTEFRQQFEAALPRNRHGLLVMNSIYFEALQEKYTQIDQLMKENEEKRKKLYAELEESKKFKKIKQWNRVATLMYIPPYFRDFVGMAPGPNRDTVFKQEEGELNVLAEPTQNWTKSEKEKLLKAVMQAAFEIEARDLIKQQQKLLDEYKLAGPDEHTAIEKEIERVNKKIEKFKKKFDLSKVPQSSMDLIDWTSVGVQTLRSSTDCRSAYSNLFRTTLKPNKCWSVDEKKRLIRLVKKYGEADWDKIAKELEGRTSFQCLEKYQEELNEEMHQSSS